MARSISWSGVYYETFDRPFFNSADLFHVFNPVAQNYAIVSMDSKSSGDYFSGFAQVRWDILANLELAAGARYSQDEKDIRIVNVSKTPSPTYATLFPVGQALTSSYSDDNVSPEATLTWRPDDNQTLYAAYKTGYKAGGISNPYLVFTSATPAELAVPAGRSEGLRGGLQGDAPRPHAASGRCRLQLRLRRSAGRLVQRRHDQLHHQQRCVRQDRRRAGILRMVGAGRSHLARQRRLQPCGVRKLPERAMLSGSDGGAGLRRPSGATQNLAGKALLRAPELTFSLGADYRARWVTGWDTTFSVQGSHYDAFQTATDYAPGGFQESFWLLNAAVRLGPRMAGTKWL